MYQIIVFSVMLLRHLAFVYCEEGDSCQLSTGEQGRCTNLNNCPYGQNLLRNGVYPQICGFVRFDSLVCCKNEFENLVQRLPGDISFKKCQEYYPYPIHGILLPGGERSLAQEFPHMAAIGFGDRNNIEWLCGGSLISMKYVLTAAHCLNSMDLGPPRWVRLGELDFATNEDLAAPQDFTIVRRILHPNYRPPAKYHDIALLELDRPINRTTYVNIACLDTVRKHTEDQMIATGWGKTEYVGESSSYLLKINLDLPTYDNCQAHYRNYPLDLPNGVLDDLQICAGGKKNQDTCQGDSGGPLQIRNHTAGSLLYVYNIVGVTSFGKACGISRSPGIYARVYNYLSWIEDVVWPS